MVAPRPLTGIVVLNFNGHDCLLACLRSLYALQYKEKCIVVVDNGSHDGSLAAALALYPDLMYLRNEKNLGFSAGMNVGIKEALARGAQWIWLFNNDATTEPDTLDRLMTEALAHPKVGLLSPRIFTPGKAHVWFEKGRIDFWRMRVLHIPATAENLLCSAYESPFLTGCALLIKKEVLSRVGMLDEHFFLYYEDADLCVRARAKHYTSLVVPQALVYHQENSQKNSRKTYFLVLSGLLFFAKHYRGWQKTYLALYVTIRRLKNWLDIVCGRDGATGVRQAYDHYSHDS